MSNPGSETNYVNDYATIPVPLDQRRSSFSLAMVLVGSIICLSSIYVGASFVGQLSLSEVVTACLVGNAVLSVLGGLLSYIGTKTGVGIAMLMRQSFGVLGNYIIAVLTAIVELGWFGYQCGFFGSTIHAMFPNAGFITEPVVAGIWGGLLMMTTAFIGYKVLNCSATSLLRLSFSRVLLRAVWLRPVSAAWNSSTRSRWRTLAVCPPRSESFPLSEHMPWVQFCSLT